MCSYCHDHRIIHHNDGNIQACAHAKQRRTKKERIHKNVNGIKKKDFIWFFFLSSKLIEIKMMNNFISNKSNRILRDKTMCDTRGRRRSSTRRNEARKKISSQLTNCVF